MSIFMVLFGVFWLGMAMWMGAVIMVPFGLIFIGIAIYSAYHNFKNATSENRYSEYDIVDSDEETDPLNEKYGKPEIKPQTAKDTQAVSFCPYCGTKTGSEFVFCAKCGKKLPK